MSLILYTPSQGNDRTVNYQWQCLVDAEYVCEIAGWKMNCLLMRIVISKLNIGLLISFPQVQFNLHSKLQISAASSFTTEVIRDQ
jgi:hypothetical protein